MSDIARLSDMENMVDRLQSDLQKVYKFGVALETKFDVELVSEDESEHSLDEWNEYWSYQIFKLKAIHKMWGSRDNSNNTPHEIRTFFTVCEKID